MCKIMTIVGIPEKKNDQVLRFIKAAAPLLSRHDDDGFGYSGLSRKHGLFGERWVRNVQAFNVRETHQRLPAPLAKLGENAFVKSKVYARHGEADPVEALKDVSTLTLHARAATNGGVCVANTHPFVRDGVSLIHNGIVEQSLLRNLSSTTDSEGILNAYVDARVGDNPARIKEVTDQLWGYYACAVLAPDDQGRYILDIFKDDGASLYASYVREIEAVVFCTSKEIIQKTCENVRFHHTEIFEVQSELLIRIDPEKGDLIAQIDFESNGYRRSYGQGYGHQWASTSYQTGQPDSEVQKESEEIAELPTPEQYADPYRHLTAGWPDSENEDVDWEWEDDLPAVAKGGKK